MFNAQLCTIWNKPTAVSGTAQVQFSKDYETTSFLLLLHQELSLRKVTQSPVLWWKLTKTDRGHRFFSRFVPWQPKSAGLFKLLMYLIGWLYTLVFWNRSELWGRISFKPTSWLGCIVLNNGYQLNCCMESFHCCTILAMVVCCFL